MRILPVPSPRVPSTTARSGRSAATALLITLLGIGSASADQTPALPITSIDSLLPQAKFVSLQGYTNAACDGQRIRLESTDAEYAKQMFAIALSAFHAGTPVVIVFTASGGQCIGSRIIAYKQ